jgi:hypothetical protein
MGREVDPGQCAGYLQAILNHDERLWCKGKCLHQGRSLYAGGFYAYGISAVDRALTSAFILAGNGCGQEIVICVSDTRLPSEALIVIVPH